MIINRLLCRRHRPSAQSSYTSFLDQNFPHIQQKLVELEPRVRAAGRRRAGPFVIGSRVPLRLSGASF